MVIQQKIFDSLYLPFFESSGIGYYKALVSDYFHNMLSSCSRKQSVLIDTAIPVTQSCGSYYSIKRKLMKTFDFDVQQPSAKRRKIVRQNELDSMGPQLSVQEIRKKKRTRQKQKSQLNHFYVNFFLHSQQMMKLMNAFKNREKLRLMNHTVEITTSSLQNGSITPLISGKETQLPNGPLTVANNKDLPFAVIEPIPETDLNSLDSDASDTEILRSLM